LNLYNEIIEQIEKGNRVFKTGFPFSPPTINGKGELKNDGALIENCFI